MKLVINNQEIIQIKIANNFLTRIKGLIGYSNIDFGLIIYPCNSIHTFFMQESIDVLFVNKNNTIIKINKNYKPWQLGTIIWNAKYVIELPLGTVERYNILQNHKVYLLE